MMLEEFTSFNFQMTRSVFLALAKIVVFADAVYSKQPPRSIYGVLKIGFLLVGFRLADRDASLIRHPKG
jgi:hypothetical protein